MTYFWTKEYNNDILITPEDNIINEIDGGMTHAEGLRLSYLASIVPKDLTIVEIGSFKGRSTCFLGMGSKYGNEAKVYGIDPWDKGLPYRDATRTYWDEENEKQFYVNIESLNLKNIVTGIKNFSLEEVKKWDKKIGLLHIDGDHTYEGVKNDYNAWKNFLVPNSIIAFHDANMPPIIKFIEEVKLSGLFKDFRQYNRLMTAIKI